MKNKPLLISGVLAVGLAVCISSSAFAAEKKAASPSPSASAAASSEAGKTERGIPRHGMISSVDQSAKTFTIAGKEKSDTFKVTDKTVIKKSGQPATMQDITEKQEVRIYYVKNADGTLEAKTVKLGAKTEDGKKSGKSASASASPSASASASASPKP